MNKERILELASDLKAPELPKVQTSKGEVCPHFNMRNYVAIPYEHSGEAYERNWCDTACCIGGLAILKWSAYSPALAYVEDNYILFAVARKLLDLDMQNAQELFNPGTTIYNGGIRTQTIANDKAWAARCLEKLAETGIVDWKGTRDDQKL